MGEQETGWFWPLRCSLADSATGQRVFGPEAEKYERYYRRHPSRIIPAVGK